MNRQNKLMKFFQAWPPPKFIVYFYTRVSSVLILQSERLDVDRRTRKMKNCAVKNQSIHICTHLDSVRVGAVDAPDEFNDFSRINVMERASNNNILSF